MKKTGQSEKASDQAESNKKGTSFFSNHQVKTTTGVFSLLLGIFLCISFVSFFFAWQEDQSILSAFEDRTAVAENLLGKIGAGLSHFLIYRGFGIAAFEIPILMIIAGIYQLLLIPLKKILKPLNWGLLGMLWVATSFGFSDEKFALLAGVVGRELNEYLSLYLGNVGLILFLVFGYLVYFIIRFDLNLLKLRSWFIKKTAPEEGGMEETKMKSQTETVRHASPLQTEVELDEQSTSKTKSEFELSLENLQPTIKNFSSLTSEEETDPKNNQKATDEPGKENATPATKTNASDKDVEKDVKIAVEKNIDEERVSENLADNLVEKFGLFDPKLELGNFKFPTLNLLKEYNETIAVDAEELERNKNKIVDTLKNYKIGIAKIKATVGPTVTLYEIIPDAGIRISKIKNLEDDIALSLSALGIRIIAPIPGKGTIGIEVPNNKPTIVSMRSVIASTKFQESKMELPIALGKTISNETFVMDLAKMPHLLMAGATGQGKSVGLNTILTSLLYKKHPAEVKFVLVDPKKVELTLFNKIERHYLAKLPDTEEAIITDTTKVVHTLNSLCIEMDNRYDLLKTAMVRNIKEYNTKFKARKLNPDNGHQFLPYIVLVIDEFADLIMTAGKEVETPIARLAQLARAIGIHLIVATQRPSVNVITGIIKANFPCRIAFRVTSKIDSRTILDASGADQLIGKGDLLYAGGSEMIRIQCAFVDTPEVEKITDYIGSQKAYPQTHLLPEYSGEETGNAMDMDISDRDPLFEEAAKLIIQAQQGSASLLQRKLKLGYNRAGRLIDQLEAAGIVGPFEGSKARQVLLSDNEALNQLLNNEKS